MMIENPKISIIVPVFNTEKFLQKTLQSVLDQTFTDWELICVDDGSTDSSPNILKEFSLKDPRVKLYHKENSGKASVPFNLGLSHSKGNYVFAMGCDDYISENCLECAFKRALETGADAIIPDMQYTHPFFSQKNRRIEGVYGDRNIVLTNREAVVLSLNWQIHAFAFWRGDLLRRIKFDEEGMNGDQFSVRVLMFNSNKIVFCEGTYFYVQHTKSITKKISIKLFDVIRTNEKLLLIIKKQQFESDVIEHFELLCLTMIFMRYLLFKKHVNDFSANDQIKIQEIIKKSFLKTNLANCRKGIKFKKGYVKKTIFFMMSINYFCFKMLAQIIFRSNILSNRLN